MNGQISEDALVWNSSLGNEYLPLLEVLDLQTKKKKSPADPVNTASPGSPLGASSTKESERSFWTLSWAVWRTGGLNFMEMDHDKDAAPSLKKFLIFLPIPRNKLWKQFHTHFNTLEREFAIYVNGELHNPIVFVTSKRLVIWDADKKDYMMIMLRNLAECSVQKDMATLVSKSGETRVIKKLVGFIDEDCMRGILLHAHSQPPWSTAFSEARTILAEHRESGVLPDNVSGSELAKGSSGEIFIYAFATARSKSEEQDTLRRDFGIKPAETWSPARWGVLVTMSIVFFVGQVRYFEIESLSGFVIVGLFSLLGGGAASEQWSKTWEGK